MNPVEAAKLLEEKNNILIVTHKNPDGDTVGSASALCHALRRIGKTACLFPNPAITEKLLPYARDFFPQDGYESEFLVAVDVADTDMQCKGADFSYDLVIDHHPTNPEFGAYNCIYSERSSCGEIVLEVIEALCGNIDTEEADRLYIAVSTDTGCFQYANTNENTLSSAAKLVGYGANSYYLNTVFFRKVSKARILLEGMIYSGMRFYHEGKVVVSVITRKMLEDAGTTENDLDDIAALPGRIDTEIVGITVRENADGSSKVSMRSTNVVDSSAVCAAFGGGGHKMASGCTIYEKPQEAASMVLAELDKVWTDSF